MNEVIMKKEIEFHLKATKMHLDALIEKFELCQMATPISMERTQFGLIADKLRKEKEFIENTLDRCEDLVGHDYEFDISPNVYEDRIEGIKYVKQGDTWTTA
jgi:hypothetical protein